MMAEANPILAGVVEIDEMYAGAPPRKPAKPSRDHDDQELKNPQGRGTKRSLVLVAAKRGGDVVAKVIRTHGKGAITSALDGVLNDTATVMTDGLPAYKYIGKTQPHHAVNHSAREYARTDELPAYRWIGSKFPAHLHVNHSKGEYVRRDPLVAATAHTNTAESFNATLKRAVIGVWHWFSTKHTDRYLSEVSFRWNRRKQGADARPAGLFTGNGGRLRWKELVA